MCIYVRIYYNIFNRINRRPFTRYGRLHNILPIIQITVCKQAAGDLRR